MGPGRGDAGAAASWRAALAGANAQVKTILVVPGYEFPALSANEQFDITSVMTTTLAFADTVGHWLDHDEPDRAPIARRLMDGAASGR
jgi:hypothetical protein